MIAAKRLIVRSLTAVAALAILAALAGWVLLTRSLPQLDGEFVVTGLTSTVTIERDSLGIPTITASTREDLAFGTGFVHAQDRFFQMDMIRRRSAGELSDVIGRVTLEQDKRARLHRFRARAKEAINRLSKTEAEILSAYADGVNAGLAKLRARPFEYFLLGVAPEPWLQEDSILAVYTMFMRLNYTRASRDVARGLVHRVLPPTVFGWLYPAGTEWDAPLMGTARKTVRIPGPDEYNISSATIDMASLPAIPDEPEYGSNNWAVSGALTDSGRALVANDMHLGISVPVIWYRARLRVVGDQPRDLSGVTLPGAPIVPAGSNTSIAWGNTNSNGDWADAVIVIPGKSPDSYVTSQGEKKFTVYREQIRVKGAASEELVVRETVWGPIDDGHPDPEYMLAISWIAHRPDGINSRHLFLESATSVDEALDIANTIGMPPQNFVVGDAQGNIGWTIAGKIPRRSGEDSTLPVDWSDGGAWDGWLTPGEYPRIVNPDSGRIWTANARVADGAALDVVGTDGYSLGARAKQIRDGLQQRNEFSPQDMLDIQLDARAIFLARWRELLLDVLDRDAVVGNPAREKFRLLAENWIPRATADSVGYRLVRGFRLEVRDRVFNMLMQPVRQRFAKDVELMMSRHFEAPLWSLVSEQPAHLITLNYASWKDLLLASVDARIAYFADNFDGELADRTWGERNTAEIRHPLSGSIPVLGDYLNMSREPLDGDSNLPRAQGPAFGASERFGVAPGDEGNGFMQVPVGQSGHPLSEFYDNGHDDWVKGKFTPFLPSEARHTLVLRAAP